MAVISVIVHVFNHAPYLDKSLSGIEMQEFSGDIEVVLHDDASTDRSAEVYEAHAAKSRHRYKIIRQVQNKYSRNISVLPEIFEAATGEYLAMCEGDDYWTSPLKISNQHLAMEVRRDVDICFHKASRVHFADERTLGFQGDYGDKPVLFPAATIVEGGGGFMPSPSLMLRRTVLDTLPSWYFDPPPVGDYFMQVFGSLRGGAMYLPMCAAAYRQGDPQSWTQRVTRDLKTLNDFSKVYYKYLLRLQGSVPPELRGNVEVMLKKVYTEYCSRCFDFKNFGDMPSLVEIIDAGIGGLQTSPSAAG